MRCKYILPHCNCDFVLLLSRDLLRVAEKKLYLNAVCLNRLSGGLAFELSSVLGHFLADIRNKPAHLNRLFICVVKVIEIVLAGLVQYLD